MPEEQRSGATHNPTRFGYVYQMIDNRRNAPEIHEDSVSNPIQGIVIGVVLGFVLWMGITGAVIYAFMA
jgi:hypothetical protein